MAEGGNYYNDQGEFMSMMTEPDHSFAAAKEEAPTRVGHMKGPAGSANGEATLETSGVLGHDLGLTILT
ncbi:hypothetical protein JOQ06_023411 [Pogonophryne albipinna]|uniref:Uncharacterized protein n=1 Tax=Pogonophryne albipinna TaxID=1090488 RepID=A0AAD6BMR6_9TELE|nr:hypothetical protein JOQ06_023411 [Pogonophryne albipinna]